MLWGSHMQPQTPPVPLDVITRSCSPVGALPDIQVHCAAGVGAKLGLAGLWGQVGPWGAQDTQNCSRSSAVEMG